MRQERLLSVGTDGGGYINLCTNKDDLSLCLYFSRPLALAEVLGHCRSHIYLDLGWNNIGDEGRGGWLKGWGNVGCLLI